MPHPSVLLLCCHLLSSSQAAVGPGCSLAPACLDGSSCFLVGSHPPGLMAQSTLSKAPTFLLMWVRGQCGDRTCAYEPQPLQRARDLCFSPRPSSVLRQNLASDFVCILAMRVYFMPCLLDGCQAIWAICWAKRNQKRGMAQPGGEAESEVGGSSSLKSDSYLCFGGSDENTVGLL